MDRREFVAALVAAGVVSAGLNLACDKPQTGSSEQPASNNNANAQTAPEPATAKTSNDVAVNNSNDKAPSANTRTAKGKPGRTPPRDNPVQAQPTATPEAARTPSAGDTQSTNKPRRKPLSDNPAGDAYTSCFCEKIKDYVDCCYDEDMRVIPCPSMCPF